MAAYQGGQFPYWITITNDGTHSNPGMQSEQIPVAAGLNYQFGVVCSYASSWASGMGISLEFYNASGSPLTTFTASQTNMTSGALYSVNTGMVTAPAGSAYAVASITQTGLPGSALAVYQAEIDDQNYVQVNINFTFTWNFWPWTEIGTGGSLAWNVSNILSGDSDSLVLDGIIEFMGGQQGVQCDVPELLDANGQGPTFRILAPPSLNSAAFGYEASYDLNAPQPTQDVVSSMLLDGERPFGARSSNRTMSLPVVIFGTMTGGMNQVLKAREYLMSIIDQQVFPIKWTPADTGLAMIFDCFRALPSTPLYGFNYSSGGTQTGQTIGRPNYPIAMITLEIQALPFGRSDIDGMQSLALGSPIVNGTPTNVPQILDQFSTVFSPPPVINEPSWTTQGTSAPTSVTTWNQALGSNVAAGNTMVIEIMAAANTVTGVTDTQGNVYALAGFNQAGSAAIWQYVYTAPVQTALTSGTDHLTVTSSASGSFESCAFSIVGAWSPRAVLPINQDTTGTSYTTNLGGLNSYDMLVSFTAGLSAGMGDPTGFTEQASTNGNGFYTYASYYCEPINQTTLTYSVSGLPNPASIMVFAFQPVNQYWNQDALANPGGSDSAHYIPPRPMHMPWPAAIYQHTLPTAVSITGLPVLSVWFGQSYDTQWPKDPKFTSNVTLRWTLTDTSGRTLSFSVAKKKVLFGANPTAPKWTRINASIPQGHVFSYNAVASYSVRITNWSGSGHTGYVRMHCWLNDIVANPQTIQNQMSPRGNVYNLFALPGSARAPISVQCQQPAALPITKELTTPLGSTGNFIVPPGVYSLYGENWGGGGAGASLNLGRTIAGGGGGGAEYAAEPSLAVMPGRQIPYLLGSAGLGGQLNSTVIQFTTPGLGHWTCPANITSVLAETWGAGAAGAAGGGGGGGGSYSSKTVTVVPGVTYYLWVGRGGKADLGITAAQDASRSGAGSWFGPNGNKYAKTATVSAPGGSYALTGATGGGYGGVTTGATAIGTTKFAGGRGGKSPGSSGGGGGGAGGSTAAGGYGGDSQVHTLIGNAWQTGGTAGLGGVTGGGNGGAGAGTPGFPVAGAVPGGGGGGGYTSISLGTTVQPAVVLPGSQNVNYLGADGGNGMVQLTYSVNSGSPVNGGTTTFGSVATTGVQVVAHGGQSVANNSAAGALGGTGSSNTLHENGGPGGLITSGANGSYLLSPTVASLTYLNSANNGSSATASVTTGVSGASIAQGVALAQIYSQTPVADLVVSDTAGNLYQLTGGEQGGGSSGTGITAYCYVADIEFPITTSTTLTLTSATSQLYGVLWQASPFLTSGVTSGNAGTGNGTGSLASGQFNVTDQQSLEIELAVIVTDGSQTISSLPNSKTKVWFPSASTSSVSNGASGDTLISYIMANQGGGTGAANSGDVFSATLTGSCNWAVLCVPLLLTNQSAAMVKMDWRTGTTPGAQTTWATEAAISANGYIMVIGLCGTGSGITAGPSAIGDASGNVYTFRNNTVIPGSGGAMFLATAPVTQALAAGTTGTYNWGHSSAVPDYTISTYWIPNAVGIDAHGVSAVTGAASAVSGAYAPASPNDMLIAAVGNDNYQAFGITSTGWNYQDEVPNSPVIAQVYGAQAIDLTNTSFTGVYSAATNWALLLIGVQLTLAGTGGGAAGGPRQAGYPGIWQQGAPGHAGAYSGKGGTGAGTVNTNGGSAAVPGGGGGGAYANNTGVNQGGRGGQGMIRVSWNPPLTVMNNLIIHSLGPNSDPNVSPIVPIPITDSPNNTEYTVPSVTGLVPATFGSTYTVLLVANSWNPSTAGSARQITLTVNQYEYPGGPRYSVQVTRAVTPSTDVTNGFVSLGEVTLPIKDYVNYNDQSYFTVSINDTDQTDRFMDVLFLDTTGQTVLINIDQGAAGYGQYVNFFIDEATADRDLGFVGASFQDRQHQVSVLDYTLISGGPLMIAAGDNLFLCYSTAGAPDLAVNYAPRWFLDRAI